MFNISKGKGVKKKVVAYLIERRFITKNDSFLCSNCVCHVKKLLVDDNTVTLDNFLTICKQLTSILDRLDKSLTSNECFLSSLNISIF